MLPWEHVAVGYVVISVVHRLVLGRPPDARVALAAVAAALVPDLIDKPLAWEYGVLPGGRSLAHSLLFAIPATALVGVLARGRVAVAFGLSYLAHLLTDVYFPVVFGGEPVWSFLAWPLTQAPPSDTDGFLVRTGEVFADVRTFLASTEGQAYVAFEVLLLGTAFVLWLLDGAPALRLGAVRDGLRRDVSGER